MPSTMSMAKPSVHVLIDIFERGDDLNSSWPSAEPPEKPPRTFDHCPVIGLAPDLSQSANTNGYTGSCQKKALVICKPTPVRSTIPQRPGCQPPPPPAAGSGDVQKSVRETGTQNVSRPNRIQSHEYEHICGIDRHRSAIEPVMRKSLSLESIYAKPSIVKPDGCGEAQDRNAEKPTVTTPSHPKIPGWRRKKSKPSVQTTSESLYYESNVVPRASAQAENDAPGFKQIVPAFRNVFEDIVRRPAPPGHIRIDSWRLSWAGRRSSVACDLIQKTRNKRILTIDVMLKGAKSDALPSENVGAKSGATSPAGEDNYSIASELSLNAISGAPSSVTDAADRQRQTRQHLVRQKTFLYHGAEVAFKALRNPQLFELFAFITLKRFDARLHPQYQDRDWRYMPVVDFSVPPPHYISSHDLLSSLPFLCYPDFSTARPVSSFPDEYFMVTLTDQNAMRKFVYCCRFLDLNVAEATPDILCIISPVQASVFYQELLAEAMHRLRLNRALAVDFLKSVFHKPYPEPGRKLVISTGLTTNDLVLSNRSSDQHTVTDTFYLLSVLGAESLLILFSALLCEKRVLLIGQDVSSLSRHIRAITSLLFPFQWPHTLIPVIPDSHVELCLAPTPYLIGIIRGNQSNLNKLKELLLLGSAEEFLLILDVDMGVIRNESYPGARELGLPERIASGVKEILESLLTEQEKSVQAVFNERRIGRTSPAEPFVLETEAKIGELFLLVFVELMGHYRNHVSRQQDGGLVLASSKLIEGHQSRSVRKFLRWFTDTGMYQVWKSKKLEDFNNADDVFDRKIREVLATAAPSRMKNMKKFAQGVKQGVRSTSASVLSHANH